MTLPQIELPTDLGAGGPEPLSADKRVHFIPSAKVIVTIPATNDRLVLHRFDVDKVKDAPPGQVQPPAPAKRPGAAAKEGAARELRNLRISKNSYVHALAFTPDGHELLSAGDDGRVRRWQVATGRELATSFDAHPRVSMLSVSVSADGRLLATGAIDKTAKVWDAATNKLLATCTEKLRSVRAALSPDGTTLATGSTQVRLWNARSGEALGSLTGQPCFIESLAFSRDGKLLACTGSQHTVKLWDVAAQKERATLSGHTGLVMAVAFPPDGRTLASAGMDRTVRLWDLTTHKERRTLTGHEDPVSSIAFSPDGSLLLSGAGATRFNPGRRGEVKLWDVASGRCLTDLRGHQDGVSAVAFSPDGKTVATAARDRTVRLWDVSAFAGAPAP
jgi:WD40 repeat protein